MDSTSAAADAVAAFEAYGLAEQDMRSRVRDRMGMADSELTVLRHLVRAERGSLSITPGELARRMQFSTASMTALLDRLERTGHIRRCANPDDRRSLHVLPTALAHDDVRETLGAMHERMLAAVADMSPEEIAAMMDFLARLQRVVDAAPDVGGNALGPDAA